MTSEPEEAIISDAVAEFAEYADAPKLPPILQRLTPMIISRYLDAPKTQPQIGATLQVVDTHKGEVKTIFFPGDVWFGIATLIRQTPDHLRSGVAEFLKVLHMQLDSTDATYFLMVELIEEVEHDPYGEWPEIPPNTFDANW
jgi:hypothetical protein